MINWKLLEKHKRNLKNHNECAWCGGATGCTSKEADAEWVKVYDIWYLFAAENSAQPIKAKIRYLRKRIEKCYV
jgi:hypothetical protein